jgi:hypothetical protein
MDGREREEKIRSTALNGLTGFQSGLCRLNLDKSSESHAHRCLSAHVEAICDLKVSPERKRADDISRGFRSSRPAISSRTTSSQSQPDRHPRRAIAPNGPFKHGRPSRPIPPRSSPQAFRLAFRPRPRPLLLLLRLCRLPRDRSEARLWLSAQPCWHCSHGDLVHGSVRPLSSPPVMRGKGRMRS